MKGESQNMKSICIKTNNSQIIHYLLNQFINLGMEHVYVSNHTFKIYENVIIHYTGEDTSLFYESVCNVILDCITLFFEPKIIKNLISYNYFYFTKEEQNKIYDNCIHLLNSSEEKSEKEITLYHCIKSFLEKTHSFILSGFVNFRLKDYTTLLDEIIDTAVNKFLIDREYYEFINILKLYINSKSEETSGEVHLIYHNHSSILIDEEKHIIPTKDNILNAKYLSDISFSANDYALNTLLNILPQRITIHLIDHYSDEFIDTLKLIFEDRIQICNDCNICRIYRLDSKIHK